MSGSLLLVGNPKRRAKRRSSKKPSAAQLRVRRAFAAMSRARANPAKRRAKRRVHHVAAARRNPARRHRRAARRNPIGGSGLRSITAQIKAGVIGAAGAIGMDVIYGAVQSYLPASISGPVDTATGGANYAYYAAKIGVSVGAGLLLGKVLKGHSALAGKLVEGSITVTAHDLMKQFIATNATTVPMGQYLHGNRLGYLNPGRVVSHQPMRANLGQYIANGAAVRRGM